MAEMDRLGRRAPALALDANTFEPTGRARVDIIQLANTTAGDNGPAARRSRVLRRACAAWIAVVLAWAVIELSAHDGRTDRVASGGAITVPPRVDEATTLVAPTMTTTTVALEPSTVTTVTAAPPTTPATGEIDPDDTTTYATGEENDGMGGTGPPAGTPLSGPSRVGGVIVDPGGQPVAQACVDVFHGPPGPGSPVDHIVTGDDGRFSSTTVQMHTEADWIPIRVTDCSDRSDPFAVVDTGVMARPLEASEVTISLGPGATVFGVVVDDAMHPIDGTGLCVRIDTNTGAAYGPVQSDGRYRVAGVPPGRAGAGIIESCSLFAMSFGATYADLGVLYPTEHLQRDLMLPNSSR